MERFVYFMKGYYKRKTDSNRLQHAVVYKCNHPLYSTCTLFKSGEMGLAVVQKRFNPDLKVSWWDVIDPWIANDMYEEKGFYVYFSKHAGFPVNGLYPTVDVRKMMYALNMKPLKKKYWEMEV